jgi:hypothetical protein
VSFSQRGEGNEFMHPEILSQQRRRKRGLVLVFATMAILLGGSNLNPSVLWPSMGLVLFTVSMRVRQKLLPRRTRTIIVAVCRASDRR